MGERVVLIARLALLALAFASSLVLAACDDCPDYTAPITFRVAGDCGAPGIVVIEESGSGYWSSFNVHNGQPTLGATGGSYDRASCPRRPLDGFSLQGMDRTCNAVRDGDGVTVLCDLRGGRTCRAHLTPVQD